MAQGSVRLDKLQATKGGSQIISFSAPADFQNGFVFHAEDLVSGERELFTATQPATATISAKSIFLHASVEINYLAGQTINDFYVANGGVCRGILLRQGDILTISDNVISGTTVVGQYVAPQDASYQLAISATAPTTKFVGKIIEKTTIYGQAATVIEVLAN